VEINGNHILDAGTSPLPFQGVDVVNLGQGEDDEVISLALGGEVRPAEDWAFRGSVEFPLTDEEDLYGWRMTWSVVFSF